ncbi:hypothetical protein IMZ16_05635 [Cruoricaptor ignavus]|uniref:Uncharacterized protein n=1 Tax=Cruoricaptor ignavus TaxID=1118202 RepID=A0A7M1SZM3_9FLAO|nr:hypothetical protein [Cruoricaptor ignavus]QOR73030.1 hypothetical protein IMZ16_05635 [Cruoricaptor ignavus]
MAVFFSFRNQIYFKIFTTSMGIPAFGNILGAISGYPLLLLVSPLRFAPRLPAGYPLLSGARASAHTCQKS